MKNAALRRFGYVIGICAVWLFAFPPQGGFAQQDSVMAEGQDYWCCDPDTAIDADSEAIAEAMAKRSQRHREFIQGGVPVEYRNRFSPYPATSKFVGDGGAVYAAHCAACHGANGMGDGDAGNDLRPSPALLAFMIERPQAIDGYLLWSIAEGGAAFGSAMPAFKDKLDEPEIWQTIIYMRAGFPALPAATRQ